MNDLCFPHLHRMFLPELQTNSSVSPGIWKLRKSLILLSSFAAPARKSGMSLEGVEQANPSGVQKEAGPAVTGYRRLRSG